MQLSNPNQRDPIGRWDHKFIRIALLIVLAVTLADYVWTKASPFIERLMQAF